MRLCFLPDKKVSKSTQVEDADFPEEEDEEDEEEEDMDGDISDDSQESVSLLAEAKKHRYICSIFCSGENIHCIFCKKLFI